MFMQRMRLRPRVQGSHMALQLVQRYCRRSKELSNGTDISRLLRDCVPIEGRRPHDRCLGMSYNNAECRTDSDESNDYISTGDHFLLLNSFKPHGKKSRNRPARNDSTYGVPCGNSIFADAPCSFSFGPELSGGAYHYLFLKVYTQKWAQPATTGSFTQ